MVHGRVIKLISVAFCLAAESTPISAQAVNWSDLEGVVVDADIQRDQRTGRLGLSASVTSLTAKVQSLTKKLKRQQRQINRLRRQVKGS